MRPEEEKQGLQEDRMWFAKDQLHKIGIDLTFDSNSEIRFIFKGHEVKFFPFTGWHTGKSIKDGRGLKNLLKQL
jgi:hypothetical protein